jgi:hypothetical protein
MMMMMMIIKTRNYAKKPFTRCRHILYEAMYVHEINDSVVGHI